MKTLMTVMLTFSTTAGAITSSGNGTVLPRPDGLVMAASVTMNPDVMWVNSLSNKGPVVVVPPSFANQTTNPMQLPTFSQNVLAKVELIKAIEHDQAEWVYAYKPQGELTAEQVAARPEEMGLKSDIYQMALQRSKDTNSWVVINSTPWWSTLEASRPAPFQPGVTAIMVWPGAQDVQFLQDQSGM